MVTEIELADLIERLRRPTARTANSEFGPAYENPDGPEAADKLEALSGRIEAVRKVIEEGYPGQPTKIEQCKHGRYGYEGCITCYDEALLNALDGVVALAQTQSEG
jgi:hypothetical protein